VIRPRRRLFTLPKSPRAFLVGLLAYIPELLLVVGLGLMVWAVTWWSTPIAILTAGAAAILLAWLVAVSSRGSQ
jgi:hypothetical protein